MGLDSIILKAAISAILAAPPMISRANETASEPTKRDKITMQMNEFLDSEENYRASPVSLEAVIENPAAEPVLDMSHLTRRYRGYLLTEDEYSQVQSYIGTKKLKADEIRPYLGFVNVMRHERLINFVASHYGIDPMSILDVINQESAFQIRAIGPFKERGLGQHKAEKARFLMQEMTDPESELYYPFMDSKGYEFSMLSRDYRLSIIMIAAGIKIADANLDKSLEKESMTREELADKIREVGSSTRFSYLNKGDNTDFKFYSISKRFVRRMNSLWRANGIDGKDLTYMAYNGGKDAVRNFLHKRIISEVLLINLTNYSRRRYILDRFLDLYYGFIDEDNQL